MATRYQKLHGKVDAAAIENPERAKLIQDARSILADKLVEALGAPNANAIRYAQLDPHALNPYENDELSSWGNHIVLPDVYQVMFYVPQGKVAYSIPLEWTEGRGRLEVSFSEGTFLVADRYVLNEKHLIDMANLLAEHVETKINALG